jgi:glucokinase
MERRPLVAQAPDAPSALHIGIEIAQSATRVTVIAAPDPSARRWHARFTAPPTPDELVAELSALIARARADLSQPDDNDAPAVGVAFWGDVDTERGVVLDKRLGPGWLGFPLAARLGEVLRAPVRLEIGTAVAALAEWRQGAGRGSRTLLYVHNARAITSTIVAAGTLVRGAAGAGGMLGHMRIAPDGARCACGGRGHLDPVASAQAIVRTMIGRAADSDESTAAMLAISGRRAEAMTAAQVVTLAVRGDAIAAGIVGEATAALALALANAATVIGPDRIVIGGPLVEAGEAFFAPLNARFAALVETYQAPAPIVPAALEPYAALLGAIGLV